MEDKLQANPQLVQRMREMHGLYPDDNLRDELSEAIKSFCFDAYTRGYLTCYLESLENTVVDDFDMLDRMETFIKNISK